MAIHELPQRQSSASREVWDGSRHPGLVRDEAHEGRTGGSQARGGGWKRRGETFPVEGSTWVEAGWFLF